MSMFFKSFLLVLAFSCLSTANANVNAQTASPQCQACRHKCVSTRVACKATACAENGGTVALSSCLNVKNNSGYVAALARCENSETACRDRCVADKICAQ
jgi:hypothetical protein